MKEKNRIVYKKWAWFSIFLCGLCCTLPLIGVATGIGALTALGAYLEKIGTVSLGIAGILFAFYFYQKNKTAKTCSDTCGINCACKAKQTV